MGYTHYWGFKSSHGNADFVEKRYQLAIRQCQRIIKAYNKELKSFDPKHPARLSGYSVHTKLSQYGGLNFNGTGDLSHETFAIREHFNQNSDFDFCKTARKPYDTVVVACLITLKHYLGKYFECSSDGECHNWESGLKLAMKVLKIKSLIIPTTITERQFA